MRVLPTHTSWISLCHFTSDELDILPSHSYDQGPSLCLPHIRVAAYGSAGSCTEWFNPYLKMYMNAEFTAPAPITLDHWPLLSRYYIKGELAWPHAPFLI